MFETERFIADCRARAGDGSPAVLDVVARAVAAPADVMRVLGEPRQAGLHVIARGPDVTILNVVWGPGMSVIPHNHNMWAVIGIYSGREDNIFWRRRAGDPGRIDAAGAKALGDGDATPLGPDIVHSVLNPIKRLTGAIHVYGGDFFAVERSEWDPERLREQPYDVDKMVALFEASNRLHPAG